MADNDLEIRVRSSADLSALKQAQDAVDDLAARTKRINIGALEAERERTRAYIEAGGGLGPGGAFGEGGAGYEGLTHAAAEAQRSTLLVGMNLGRARQEAIILARELATGVPTTRTLSSLLGALGPGFAVAAIGAIGMYKGFEQANKELEKLIEGSKAIGDDLVASALKWQAAARAAVTPEDVKKVAEQAVPELEKVHEKTKAIQETQIGGFAKFIEGVRRGLVEMSPYVTQGMREWAHPYSMAAAQVKKDAQDQEEMAQHRAALDLQRADRQQKALEASKDDVTETEKLNSLLKSLTDQQNSLDKSSTDYAQRWAAIEASISVVENKIKSIKKGQDDIVKATEKTVKQGAADLGETAEGYFAQSEKRQELHTREMRAAQIELDELAGRELTPEQKTRQATLQALLSPEAEKAFQTSEERRFLERDIAAGKARPGETDVEFQARMSNEAYRLNQLGPGGGEGGATLKDTNKILADILRQWQ